MIPADSMELGVPSSRSLTGYNMGLMEKKMETTIYWGYIGIMEKKMETTIHWGYIGIMETTLIYWGYIGIMEKKMATTLIYWGYIGLNGKEIARILFSAHVQLPQVWNLPYFWRNP